MSERFDEAMVDRIAREVYGNTVVIHSGPHSRNIAHAFLDAIGKTHAIVPLEQYGAMFAVLNSAMLWLRDFPYHEGDGLGRYSQEVVNGFIATMEEFLALRAKEVSPDVPHAH